MENGADLVNKMGTEEGKGIINELKGIIKNNNSDAIPTVVRKFREDFEKTINKQVLNL